MARHRLREQKKASDGSCVRLLQDTHDGSWLVGREGDPHLDPLPIGAFQSREAARHWADRTFEGGTWTELAGSHRDAHVHGKGV